MYVCGGDSREKDISVHLWNKHFISVVRAVLFIHFHRVEPNCENFFFAQIKKRSARDLFTVMGLLMQHFISFQLPHNFFCCVFLQKPHE